MIDKRMTPRGDRVVLRVVAESRARPTGLVLPEGARVRYDAPIVAVVVDVGPLVTDLRPGMEVLTLPHVDGVDIDLPGQGSYRVVGPRAVVAILSDPDPGSEPSDEKLAAQHVRCSIMVAERIRAQQLSVGPGELPPIMEAILAARGGLRELPSRDVTMGLN